MPAVSKKQQRYFGYLLSNPEERKKKGISKKAAKDFASDVQEVAPPGLGHTKAEKEKRSLINLSQRLVEVLLPLIVLVKRVGLKDPKRICLN